MKFNRFEGKGFIKSYVSGFLRAALVALILLFQIAIIFVLSYILSSYGLLVYFVIEIIGVLVIIGLVNNRTNTSFKISWLLIIAIIPIGGLIMYILWGRERSTKRIRQKNLDRLRYGDRFAVKSKETFAEFGEEFEFGVKMATFMENNNFPLYKYESIEYLPMGEDAFEAIIADCENAKKFIFFDFFIVAEGILWERIKPILIRKAGEGLEIKFLYDDFGSMLRTDNAFWNELENAGIQIAAFNPIHKYMDKLYMNYRSHQKLIIIDGDIGYTGGFNLADEYVNAIKRFGTWKDNGVRITGEGVYGLTCTFLAMWGMTVDKNVPDYSVYKPSKPTGKKAGYCQIISDGPCNNPDNPVLSVIKQLIYNAKGYLYITTPYLLIEDDLSDALVDAAQSGIDVRLITPHIPDKKAVYMLTRYSYGKLLAGGVRIYEYTPGFIHAKTIITQDVGLIGTINLDYRSLYLHYECGAVLWDRSIIKKMKKDYEETVGVSTEVTYEEWHNRPASERAVQRVLNLFSSLM